MTFAEGVLRLVRIGARVEPPLPPAAGDPAEPPHLMALRVGPHELLDGSLDDLVAGLAPAAGADEPEQLSVHMEPGLPDLEAAAALVASGLASRVILTGFPSWPGLLWRAYELAEEGGLLIMPIVVRPGGRVDIAITRGEGGDG
jgi:hypothetical protein